MPLTLKRFGAILLSLAVVIFLAQVFSGSLILSQSFPLGRVTIHYYGIIMAAAVAAGFYFAVKRAPQYGVDSKQAEDLIFWLIISGFISARVYHVLSAFNFYYSHPADIFKVWNGGLAIYGAIIGGIITLWIYNRLIIKHLALSTLLDWLTPSLILGQIIGRFGNFFNYELFGYPTNLPWKMYVPIQFRLPQYLGFHFFHPLFLYETIGNGIILFIILKFCKFKVKGGLFFSYLLLYNILRFGLVFLSIDSSLVYGIKLNTLVSLVLIICAITGLFFIHRYDKTS